jgi:hypothetical protein
VKDKKEQEEIANGAMSQRSRRDGTKSHSVVGRTPLMASGMEPVTEVVQSFLKRLVRIGST